MNLRFLRLVSQSAPGFLSGGVYALFAALLFGASTPVAKILLDDTNPWLLAGMLYLGAGVSLFAFRVVRRRLDPIVETGVSADDVPWLGGAIALGGVAAPVLLMFGLASTSPSTASLLLTLEAVFTALIAWRIFHEHFHWRIGIGMLAIVAGAAILLWPETPEATSALGPLLIVAACIAWAVDNNLTRKVSLKDPLQIAMLKGLVAGTVNLVLALTMGANLPPFGTTLLAGIVGMLGYGLSLALFVLALRHIGTARSSAYFAIAPFVGALISVVVFREQATAVLAISGGLMGLGVWLHLIERHVHEHQHTAIDHAHWHVHDAHHRHTHKANDPPGEPHAHRHVHALLGHTHAHTPDDHHRHAH